MNRFPAINKKYISSEFFQNISETRSISTDKMSYVKHLQQGIANSNKLIFILLSMYCICMFFVFILRLVKSSVNQIPEKRQYNRILSRKKIVCKTIFHFIEKELFINRNRIVSNLIFIVFPALLLFLSYLHEKKLVHYLMKN